MSNYRAYFAIEKKLKQSGMQVNRRDLIYSFTQGKKENLTALSHTEYIQFLKWLNSMSKQPNDDWKNSPENLMRRKIYTLFVIRMKYTKEQLNNWCIKYGTAHKPLSQCNYNELVALVTQAERVYTNFVQQLNN